MNKKIEEKIIEVINKIRPFLQNDGGDIEFASFEDGIVKDIRFDGEACAISTSATSIMIRSLLGKKVEEVKKILL